MYLLQEKITNLKPYRQIICVPPHVREQHTDLYGILNDPDTEYGWITSVNKKTNTVFCRYWMRGLEGEHIRTLSNSEGSDPYHLLLWKSVSDLVLAEAIKKIESLSDDD